MTGGVTAKAAVRVVDAVAAIGRQAVLCVVGKELLVTGQGGNMYTIVVHPLSLYVNVWYE